MFEKIITSKPLWVILYVSLALLASLFEVIGPLRAATVIAAFGLLAVVQAQPKDVKDWVIIHLIGLFLGAANGVFANWI